MRSERVFRLSVYLTLALATLCLSSTEEPFLPEILYFLVPVEILLAVAFVVEGRWSLSLRASNIMGVLIAAGSAVWIAHSLMAPPSQLIEAAPYPAALLPYGGPVLMMVMLAKLFRPKGINDYWGLHLIGLMEVALGCILGGEPVFSLWFFAYVGCALWSLTLFYLYRESHPARASGGARDEEGARRSAPPADHAPSSSSPWRAWGLWGTGGRALAVCALGVVLFLAAPRGGNEQWNLLNPSRGLAQVETGFASRIDLNQTGPVTVSDQVAMDLYVEDLAGRPVTDINPEQRWRGTTLELYHGGRWVSRSRDNPFGPRFTTVPVPGGGRDDLPYLGPQSILVTFDLDIWQTGGLFLAEPVLAFDPEDDPPVRSLRGQEGANPTFVPRNSTLHTQFGSQARHYRYQQVVATREDLATHPAGDLTQGYKNRLLQQPGDRTGGSHLGPWTRRVLQRLVDQGRLGPENLATGPDPEVGTGEYPLRENRARLAQALCDFLARSGEYTYRLELRRKDYRLDPTEDFLCNVKEGFCEHYATGLALMLRSIGIRSRVVSGYRGAEPRGDEGGGRGHYLVRQSHAHSWVEALITYPGPENDPNLCWLTLDPTPAVGSHAGTGFSWERWWLDSRAKLRDLWKELILDYNLQRQAQTMWALVDFLRLGEGWDAAWRWLRAGPLSAEFWITRGGWLAAAVLVFLGGFVWRRRRGLRGASSPAVIAVPFYRSWLDTVARRFHLRPSPPQTAREFGETVGRTLEEVPQAAPYARLPRDMADYYYRVRYGEEPLTPDQDVAIEERLKEVEAALFRS